MSHRPLPLFSKSLLAAAVLAASGCASTTPYQGTSGGIGDSLANAGRATADLTSRAWHRTGYLLGLHNEGNGDEFAAPPMDEVDLAMLEEDAVLPAERGGVTLAAAGVDNAMVRPGEQLPGLWDDGGSQVSDIDGRQVALNEAAAVAPAGGRFVLPADDAALEPMAALDVAPVDETVVPMGDAVAVVAVEDYTHVVGEKETLWDIAKATTGDATNWHVLADINNLAPDAGVFPGQDLMIPADMVKPELAAGEPLPAASETVVAVAATDAAPAAPAAAPVVTQVASSAASPVAPAADLPSDDARGFRINGGETLWDFAKRTTGDATYWQAIAAHNGFDEKRAVAVREGEQIFVPDVLVRAELSESAVVAAVASPVAEPIVSEPRMVPIAEASAALPADTALPATAGLDETLQPPTILDETQDIRIVEAAYRGEADGTAAVPAPAANAPAEVMISGTYYPKAIYNDADFSSSLLMRVSPGTKLRVSSIDGPWYAVETDDGVGYVHDRDIK